jgi:hypothetical protein
VADDGQGAVGRADSDDLDGAKEIGEEIKCAVPSAFAHA